MKSDTRGQVNSNDLFQYIDHKSTRNFKNIVGRGIAIGENLAYGYRGASSNQRSFKVMHHICINDINDEEQTKSFINMALCISKWHINTQIIYIDQNCLGIDDLMTLHDRVESLGKMLVVVSDNVNQRLIFKQRKVIVDA